LLKFVLYCGICVGLYRQLFCGLLGKYLLVSELHNANIIRLVFYYNFYWLDLAWQFESCVVVWRSSRPNVVGRINEVTLRRARLVLGWVTVFGG